VACTHHRYKAVISAAVTQRTIVSGRTALVFETELPDETVRLACSSVSPICTFSEERFAGQSVEQTGKYTVLCPKASAENYPIQDDPETGVDSNTR
jgi:hypothetical protein